jgi:hypothetical protein
MIISFGAGIHPAQYNNSQLRGGRIVRYQFGRCCIETLVLREAQGPGPGNLNLHQSWGENRQIHDGL